MLFSFLMQMQKDKFAHYEVLVT